MIAPQPSISLLKLTFICRANVRVRKQRGTACQAQSPKNIGASDIPPRPPSNGNIKTTSDGDKEGNGGLHISWQLLLGGSLAVSMHPTAQ